MAAAIVPIIACVLTACSGTVDGSAQRAAPGGRAALQEILPTEQEVATAVGNRLDYTAPARVGSLDVLPNGIRDSSGASPLDCLGAVTPLMRVVYESAGVQAAAWRDYARLGAGLTASSAEAGVVRFASDAEASRMFSRFVTQWRACTGTTVTLFAGPQGTAGLGLTVTDVRVDGPVLKATILSADSGGGPDFPTEHAVGVAADCLVDVDVAITDPDPYRRVAGTRAADLVRVMLTKISG